MLRLTGVPRSRKTGLARLTGHSLKAGLDSGLWTLDSGLWTLDSTLYMFCIQKCEGIGCGSGLGGAEDTGYMYFH